MSAIVEDDACIKVWLGRVECAVKALPYLKRFLSEGLRDDAVLFGLSFSELVDFQLRHMVDVKERFRILSCAQAWINGQRLALKTKRLRLSYIRSAFLHNHADLPRDLSFKFKSDVERVEGKLTVDVLRKVLLNCNPLYRPVFLMMFQAGLDESGLVYLSNHKWREILEHLTRNDGEFMVRLPGRKGGGPFCTVLSTRSDWAKAHREYLRSTSGPIQGCLFRNERGTALTKRNIIYYFNAHAENCGAIKRVTPDCPECGGETVRVKRKHPKLELRKIGYACKRCQNLQWACDLDDKRTYIRYGVNPHEMRDQFRTRWDSSGANPSVAEFMMGHIKRVDPNEYLNWMKYERSVPLREYRKALPWLNIISCDPSKVDRSSVDLELQGTKRQLAELQRKFEALMVQNKQIWEHIGKTK